MDEQRRRDTNGRPGAQASSSDADAIEDAFGRMSILSGEERVSALADLRKSDARLADEIESLLAYHDDVAGGDPRDDSADATGEGRGGRVRRDSSRVLPEPLPRFSELFGHTIGGCRIDRLIGAGGMSAVYSAMQDFPRRRVAVKVLRRERTNASTTQRLRIEAEALARLEHPNIARVYAAGTCLLPETSGGAASSHESPYIVLELVEDAVPLTSWADERGLSPVERVEIVAQVADALAHAHRAGVIHRDLKPGNVVVGRDGVPKVIDFGIATIVDAEETLGSDGPMGTLLYMSPEQASGGAVDTRTDVWGLGALLYDMLAGVPPFELERDSIAMHVARLLREAPVPVSHAARRVRDERFLAAMPFATDAVVAKALATDPERRYRSPADLADELRRLVRGEPLLARPDTEWDGILRIYRRHRAPILAASAVAIAVVAALVGALVLLRRERAAFARAEWHSYAASIAAAGGMIERADASAARDALERAPERHRNWEWRHLAGRVDQALWSVQFRRGEQVYGIDYSRDGTRILAAVSSLSVAIDVPSRTVLWARTTNADGPCWRVRILPDGGGVFVRLKEQLERLDANGAIVAIARDPEVHEIALDRACARLFSNAAGGFVVRDPMTLETVRKVDAVPPLAGPTISLALTPDERLVVLGGVTGAIVALDVETGATAWTARIPGSSSEIRGIAASPDGLWIAAVAANHVALLDARDGSVVWHVARSGRSYRSPTFTLDGDELLIATWQETIDRIDARTGSPIGSVGGIYSQVWTTSVAPDRRTFAAGGLSGRLAVFPLDASIEPATIALDRTAVRSVAAGRGPNAGRAFATTASRSLWRIDVASGASERLAPTLDASCVATGPSEPLVVGHARGVAWISPEGAVLDDVALPQPVERVTVLDDAHAFAVCETSGPRSHSFVVRRATDAAGPAVWALQQRGFDCGSAARTATKHEYYVPGGHGGGTVLLRLADEQGRLLDAPQMTDTFEQPEYPLTAALSPDGSTIAVGSVLSEGEVTLIDARTLEQRVNMPNHRGKVRSVVWSPDGTRLASIGTDDTVRIWNVPRGEEILLAWRGNASDLAWSGDGTLLIGCSDGHLRLLRATPAAASARPATAGGAEGAAATWRGAPAARDPGGG